MVFPTECAYSLAAADWCYVFELVTVVALYNSWFTGVGSQAESHVIDEDMVHLSIL